MKILLQLAWRNLWRNKRRSLITMSSVLFAVLLAILFYSLEKGSYERMIDNLVKYSTGYIQIQDVLYNEEPSIDNSLVYDQELLEVLDKMDEYIEHYLPRIQHFALASSDQISRGSLIMGLDPVKESRINNFSERMVSGRFIEPGDQDVVVAEGLADVLRVEQGDSIILLGQGLHGATAAGIYRVKGIINLAAPEMNNSIIYMDLDEAQWFFAAEDRLTAMVIMPGNPGQTNKLAGLLKERLDAEWFNVLTWKELMADLLALMEFDMAGNVVMMGILYVVITFGLLGTTLTMLLERKKEFGMLMALGMKRTQLALVCFAESIFLSLAGAVAGVLAAIPLVAWFTYHPIQLSGNLADTMIDYGFEPVIPLSSDPIAFITQARIVLVISIVVGLYSVYSIYRLNMMKARQ